MRVWLITLGLVVTLTGCMQAYIKRELSPHCVAVLAGPVPDLRVYAPELTEEQHQRRVDYTMCRSERDSIARLPYIVPVNDPGPPVYPRPVTCVRYTPGMATCY